MQPSIFVSYRREDSEDAAELIRATLLTQFGDKEVFMDKFSIQAGAEWPSTISTALDSAEVMLVIIGRKWLKVSDEWGLRRIDEENDWVRNEIEQALSRNKVVIPVLVNEARIPPADKLPRSISDLANIQAMPMRTSHWDHDINLLLSKLEDFREVPLARRLVGPYPAKPAQLVPVSDESLDILLHGVLSRWEKLVNPDPETFGAVRTELFREYTFATFSDAIHFMSELAPGIDIAQHHPRWENIYTKLRVYLHSWDIGYRISDQDIQLAIYFDKAYSDFAESRERAKRRLRRSPKSQSASE